MTGSAFATLAALFITERTPGAGRLLAKNGGQRQPLGNLARDCGEALAELVDDAVDALFRGSIEDLRPRFYDRRLGNRLLHCRGKMVQRVFGHGLTLPKKDIN